MHVLLANICSRMCTHKFWLSSLPAPAPCCWTQAVAKNHKSPYGHCGPPTALTTKDHTVVDIPGFSCLSRYDTMSNWTWSHHRPTNLATYTTGSVATVCPTVTHFPWYQMKAFYYQSQYILPGNVTKFFKWAPFQSDKYHKKSGKDVTTTGRKNFSITDLKELEFHKWPDN